MLIELKDNVHSPKTVNLPAKCSNYPDKAPENTKLLVAGWGSPGGKNAVLPTKLRCLNIEKERCARAMPPITADAFCAGKGDHKTRVGDSGGGLVLEATNEVFGVVQRGWLPDHMYPGIFTSVCSHLAWIKQVTGL
ncbi:trypsin-3-like [Megalops cyprinoides]|uniref:trypsin-3-like n=1 Tax=Megalops cyprinoides TaxID=118141 RepID=UPI0018656046|nr:trypsin-3-like [Megalops cyprinoides]